MAESKSVTKKDDQALALPEDLVVPEGAGLEDADRDSYAIPFLTILQKMSPQVDDDDPARIPGAKAGMFYDTVSETCIDPEDGLPEIIPVYYRRAFIEWKPNREGFVQEHSVEEAAQMRWERSEDGKDVLPNGNEIVDTRYHYIILIHNGQLSPMVITMSSTQVKKSKRLCSDMDLQVRALKLKATFQLKYTINTVSESNDQGSWRGWDIDRAGVVADQEQLDAAISFYKAIKAGEVKEATDSLATGDGEAAANDGSEPAF